MRFLVDVNASGSLAAWLEERGDDVARVADRDPRLGDAEILAWAVAEERIVVTTDRDFEEMVWREGRPHRGILRLENLPRAPRRALLTDVLDRHGEALAAGAVVIADTRRTRIRRPW